MVNRLFPLPFTSTCSASPPGSVPGMEDTCGFLSVWIKLGSTKGRVIGDKAERGTRCQGIDSPEFLPVGLVGFILSIDGVTVLSRRASLPDSLHPSSS